MKAQYTVVCEHQRQGQRGTFDMLGAFDRLFAPHVPVQHRALTLILQLVTDDEADLGKHEFRLRIMRPTGKPLFEQQGMFAFKPEGGSWLASVRLGFEFNGIIFPDFGKYLFALEVDGKPAADQPLTVVQQAPAVS